MAAVLTPVPVVPVVPEIRFLTFEELKTSNIVGIYKFEPLLNMNVAFRLCQLNSISKISYMNYQGYSRGTRLETRKKKKPANKCVKCFKNSICIDMGESLGLKLSQNSLQLSGFKSKETADEALGFLIHELKQIETYLHFMNMNPDLAKKSVDFIKSQFNGEFVYMIEGSRIPVEPKDIVIYGSTMYLNIGCKLYESLLKNMNLIPITSIKAKLINTVNNEKGENVVHEYPIIEIIRAHKIKALSTLVIPEGLPENLINFFVDKLIDFNNYEEYILNLDWFLSLKSVYEDISTINGNFELRNTQFSYGNNNYNYNLGFPVKLAAIYRVFKRQTGFVSVYDKDIVKFVRISLPMEVPEELATSIRNKMKIPSHKFIIYKTGSVFQSGCHPVLNKIAFERFISAIARNVDKIRNDLS